VSEAAWYRERLYDGWQQAFRVTRDIFRSDDGLQEIRVFETPGFGRVLALDGVIQVTSGDEYVYHEMMAHVPIYGHGAVRSVCVVGGGDGGMVREVLRHAGIERVVLVEIDASVIDLCRRYMPMVSNGAFDDPRLEVIIADGAAYMRDETERFDVIIVDSTDPVGPGAVLFGEPFYGACARRLTDEGILVNQNGVPFLQGGEVTDTYRRRRLHFADVGFYMAPVPTYVGGAMALGWASPSPRARSESLETIAARCAADSIDTRYYTPAIHKAAFALPRYVEALVTA
jgi:spermidine synthase